MPIYTKNGDQGETSLYGGKRVSKATREIEATGSLDELNSVIGLVASQFDVYDVRHFLEEIQSDLLTFGSILSGRIMSMNTAESRIHEMELRIDNMEEKLPKLSHFILPGGNVIACYIHISRSIARRTERQIVKYTTTNKDQNNQNQTQINGIMLKYLNRLSDFLFVLARFVNHNAGNKDNIWKVSQ